MSLGSLWQAGGVISLAALLALTLPVWATGAGFYNIGPNRYACGKREPYDNRIKNLQDQRKKLQHEEDSLPATIAQSDQQVRNDRDNYNRAANQQPPESQQDLDKLSQQYYADLGKLNGARQRYKDIPHEIEKIDKEISELGQDFSRACGNCSNEGPPPPPRPPGQTGGGQCR